MREIIYYIYLPNMSTRSKIRYEEPPFFALSRLMYHILCPFWAEIIVSELKKTCPM